MRDRYGLALAALEAGVSTEPYGPGWCAVHENWASLKGANWTGYPTQIDALAAAAITLGLSPVQTTTGVTVPVEVANAALPLVERILKSDLWSAKAFTTTAYVNGERSQGLEQFLGDKKRSEIDAIQRLVDALKEATSHE